MTKDFLLFKGGLRRISGHLDVVPTDNLPQSFLRKKGKCVGMQCAGNCSSNFNRPLEFKIVGDGLDARQGAGIVGVASRCP